MKSTKSSTIEIKWFFILILCFLLLLSKNTFAPRNEFKTICVDWWAGIGLDRELVLHATVYVCGGLKIFLLVGFYFHATQIRPAHQFHWQIQAKEVINCYSLPFHAFFTQTHNNSQYSLTPFYGKVGWAIFCLVWREWLRRCGVPRTMPAVPPNTWRRVYRHNNVVCYVLYVWRNLNDPKRIFGNKIQPRKIFSFWWIQSIACQPIMLSRRTLSEF